MIDEKVKSARIKRDMEIAVNEILHAYQNRDKPIAILLCGGYGRNEGAWYYEQGKLHTYNDYDFAVIANSKLTITEYKELRVKIAHLVGIQWVDIAFYKPEYFNKLSSTIKNVDLIYASKLIYGDNSIIARKKIDADKIGISDIIKLYRTRVWTFLGAWKGPFRNLDIEESRFFLNQMAKAVLAACDMLLISQKRYTPSYQRRVEVVCSEFADNVDLCKYAKWAICEKMNPSTKELSKDEMEELYWNIKNVFCGSLQKVVQGFWKALGNTFRMKMFLAVHSDYLLHYMYDVFVRRTKRTPKSIDIFCAQSYIFLANNRGELNESYLMRGAGILKKWGYIDELSSDWNYLREKAAWARNNL